MCIWYQNRSPLSPKSLENNEFSRFFWFSLSALTRRSGGTHDLWRCVCLFSVRGKGFRSECAVLIVNVKVTAEGGFEVNIDRQLSVLFVDDDVVYQQPQVGIADRTVLDDLTKNIDAMLIVKSLPEIART